MADPKDHAADTVFGDRLLTAVNRWHSRLEDAANLIAALFIFLLMLFSIAEIIGRGMLNRPIPGHIDAISLGMVAFSMLGVAYCQRLGGHIRMEILVANLRGRILWFVEFVGVACALIVVTVLVIGTWEGYQRAVNLGDTTPDMRWQTWPSKLAAPIALAILWFRLVLQLWGYLRLIAFPGSPLLGVPETKSVIDAAREEAAGEETRESAVRALGEAPPAKGDTNGPPPRSTPHGERSDSPEKR